MKRHTSFAVGVAAAVTAATLFAALWWAVSLLIFTWMPQLVHSRFELAFAAFIVVTLVFSFASGAWLGEVTPHLHELPKMHVPRLHPHFRP